MSGVLEIILPIFAVVALGFWAARRGGYTEVSARGLSRYLGSYALPALLFSNMARARVPDVEWGFLASFYLAACAVFVLAALWMWSKNMWENTAPVGLASSFSNIAMIGLPVILEARGPAAAVPVTLLIIFQSPLMFTLATTLAESQRTAGFRLLPTISGAVQATLFSPMVGAALLGLVVNQSGLTVPDVFDKSLDLLSRTVLPCACFALGATIARTEARGRMLSASVMAAMKTVLHPALTWLLAAKVFGLPPEWVVPAVAAAALPIGMNAYVFAERYQSGRELVSMSLLMSTLISPISLTVAFMV